jgi:hypothetical protein
VGRAAGAWVAYYTNGEQSILVITEEVAMDSPKKPVADQDIHKGAKEDDRPGPERPAHPGLDKNGMPNDPIAIAQDKLGANVDKSQG